MKILVLGAGLVGGPMAADLARDASLTVTVADRRADGLAELAKAHRVSVVERNLADPRAVFALAEAHDLVLSAVPGFMGYQTLEAILEAKKNVVDIAFFPEDALKLHELAKARGVTALVDIGVAPGMSNVLAMHAHRSLDETDSILTYVGGLPRVRRWPYEYAAVFSPIDVIEEYTRPARYVEGGRLVTRPALSDAEYLDFPGVGTLEAFNTDGLRTMAQTMSVPNMKEKTLRYPGHIELMRVLRETGFFRKEPIDVKGQMVSPLDLTTALLFPLWSMKEGDADVTILRVTVEGMNNGKPVRRVVDMVDHYDPKTNVTSMARTTGYTCTAAVRYVASGRFTRKGISPPEFIGLEAGGWDFIRHELAARNVVFRES
jgi:saccharopine dehydrogenase-like NADP-dependent oxidoreductase